jgi:hypothetical protein
MAPDVVQAQRRRVVDQRAEDATTAWQRADHRVAGLVDAPREEAGELGPGLVEDAERRVAGFGELLRGLQHSIEHLVQIEVREHAPSDIEDPLCCSIYQDSPLMWSVQHGHDHTRY